MDLTFSRNVKHKFLWCKPTSLLYFDRAPDKAEKIISLAYTVFLQVKKKKMSILKMDKGQEQEILIQEV